MADEPSIHVEYINLPRVRLRERPYVSGARTYPAALLLAQIRPHLKTSPPQPFTQHPTGDYQDKVFKVLELAMAQGVHFCVLPEFSLSATWIDEIREKIHRLAPPHSIFCLPLEHFPPEEWPAILKAAGVSESTPYRTEFDPAMQEGRLNVCWVCAKGEEGALHSHFQAKLFPAITQEGPRCEFPLQGGHIIRVFATGDDPPLHFAVLVCFDFIAGGPERPSPSKELQNFAASRSLSLDWLFVPQFNPKPTGTEFKRALQQFYPQPRPPVTLMVWANVAGHFLHPKSGRGVFGRSCLVAPLGS